MLDGTLTRKVRVFYELTFFPFARLLVPFREHINSVTSPFFYFNSTFVTEFSPFLARVAFADCRRD